MTIIIKSYRPAWYPDKKETKLSDDYSFYNSRHWRLISRLHRQKHPLCVHCKKEGKLSPAQVTDHVIPINPLYGGSKTDERNFAGLCHTCHNIKRGKERHGHIEEWILNEAGEKIPKI